MIGDDDEEEEQGEGRRSGGAGEAGGGSVVNLTGLSCLNTTTKPKKITSILKLTQSCPCRIFMTELQGANTLFCRLKKYVLHCIQYIGVILYVTYISYAASYAGKVYNTGHVS